MAITERTIHNTHTTGIPTTVYDINIKYRWEGTQKSYGKQGFSSFEEAQTFEQEMKENLKNPEFILALATKPANNPSFSDFTTNWLKIQVKVSNRSKTYECYRSNLQAHVLPWIGDKPVKDLEGHDLDNLYLALRESGVSDTSLLSIHKTISTALTYGKKSELLDRNVAENITIKFQRENKKESPYTEEELAILLHGVRGTEYELAYVLAALYGLRIGEVLGLRAHNVDIDNRTFSVVEQLPSGLSRKVKLISDLAPLKSQARTLPITDLTLPYFIQGLERQSQVEHQNHLLVSQKDGSPLSRAELNQDYKQFQKQLRLRSTRFHDLRHSCATGIYNLTGDIFGVSKILGHTFASTSQAFGAEKPLQIATDSYISVKPKSILDLLNVYHKVVLVEQGNREGNSAKLGSENKED